MRILIVTQYFWPEAFRVNDLILGLKEKGHEVVVFTGKPNYPAGSFFAGYSMFGKSKEEWNRIHVIRCPLIPRGKGNGILLLLNYLSFAFFGSLKALFTTLDYDVIIAYQQSPVIAAIPAIVFRRKKKVRMFLYIQDLWPESVTATTNLKNKFIIGVLARVTEWIYSKSDKILIQSNAFSNYLENRQVNRAKILYLPNSTDDFYRRVPKLDALAHFFTGTMHIIFAGNIGEAQSFETIIEAADIVKKTDPGIHWIFIGDGRKRAAIQQIITDKKLDVVCKFIGAYEAERMPQFFAYADALLISLKKDFIFSLTIPTKLQSYMACAKPVIGSLDGEGRAIIDKAICGLTSAAEDAKGLAENILRFKEMPSDKKNELAENAYQYFQKEFNRDRLLDRLILFLQEDNTHSI